MAEWYDVNANAVDANVVDANVVDTNVVDANVVDANVVDANAVHANAVHANAVDANININEEANKYRCNCGCNLEFIDYEPGFDIYVGNNWLITANAMVEHSWRDYISMNEFKLWQELRENIILNYNHALNNDPLQPEDAPWIHLYNREVVQSNHIPLNEKLYYE
jgi:hypothetical protein